MEEGGGPGGRGVPGALPARPVAGGAAVLPPRRPEPWWPLHTWPRPGPGPTGLGGAGAAPPPSVPSFGFVSARSWGPRGDPAPAVRLCVCSRAPRCSRRCSQASARASPRPAQQRGRAGDAARGLCSRSHVPTLRGVRVFTSPVGAGPRTRVLVLPRCSSHSEPKAS